MLRPEDVAASIRKALRVLVVEDSFMTARAIAHMLQELGAEVLGPVPSVQKAMAVLDLGQCEAAVLDINLGSETVEPVAKRLEEFGIPYFFVSGYASPKSMLQDVKYRKRRLLPKPVEPIMFNEAIAEEFGGA
jgi:two-component SAPR family response regulator